MMNDGNLLASMLGPRSLWGSSLFLKRKEESAQRPASPNSQSIPSKNSSENSNTNTTGSKEDCDHKNVDTIRDYYGLQEFQYTTYYFCEDCEEELSHDE